MHGGGIEELGLAIGLTIVDANTENLAVVAGGQRSQVKESASPAVDGCRREAFHHADKLGIGQICVPVIHAALGIIHLGLLAQRRWCHQEWLVACRQEVAVLGWIGIANDSVAVDGINGTKGIDGLNIDGVVDVETEIVFASLRHQFCQRSLALRLDASITQSEDNEKQ